MSASTQAVLFSVRRLCPHSQVILAFSNPKMRQKSIKYSILPALAISILFWVRNPNIMPQITITESAFAEIISSLQYIQCYHIQYWDNNKALPFLSFKLGRIIIKITIKKQKQKLEMCDGTQMAIFASFLHPVFPASRMQHIPDLHSKFALGPHHVWKYGRHPIYGRWD